ncbi:hypothetical protein ACIBLA_32175 [Streptomyces sp. NPDC050433]|uniref:hypothetical protein n=1 Tax=Streptomyces sp. NPDC050433 TaxID=3365615 RepID=UPI0037938401
MGMDKLHEDEESLSDVGDVEMLMDNYKRDHPTLKLTGLDVLLASLREKDEEINGIGSSRDLS